MKYEIETKQSIEIDFQQTLKMLIALNKEHRLAFKEYQSFYPPLQFIMEFGTISLDIGRHVGKTKFIRENAKCNDLVLVYNMKEVRYWNRYPNMEEDICPKTDSTESIKSYTQRFDTIWTYYHNMTKAICPRTDGIEYIKNYGQRFDTIWIDEPKLVFKGFSKYDILKYLIVDYGQTVIMLGSSI
jgi:hypothetical protein